MRLGAAILATLVALGCGHSSRSSDSAGAGGGAGSAGDAGRGGSGQSGAPAGLAGSASGASAGKSGGLAGGSGTTTGDVPLDELGEAWAEAQCAWSEACGANIAIRLPRGGCVESVTQDYANQIAAAVAAGVAAGTVRYDPEKMRACVDAAAERDCGEALPVDFGCDVAVDGTVPLDGACRHHIECEGDAYCDIADACPGVCKARGGLAAPCAYGTGCTTGYRCNVLGIDALGQCSALGAEGDRCGSCREGLGCDQLGDAICARRTFAALGEPCEGQLVRCQAGLSCASTGELDDEGQALAACADPVDSGAECRSAVVEMCPYDETCITQPHAAGEPALPGVCVTRGHDGELCEEGVGGSVCVYGAECIDGICHERRDNGAACASQDDCFSGRCADGVCSPPACDPM